MTANQAPNDLSLMLSLTAEERRRGNSGEQILDLSNIVNQVAGVYLDSGELNGQACVVHCESEAASKALQDRVSEEYQGRVVVEEYEVLKIPERRFLRL